MLSVTLFDSVFIFALVPDINYIGRWCNDEDHHVEYACSTFARYIQRIIDACHNDDGLLVRGQVFSEDGTFNVIAGQDSC